LQENKFTDGQLRKSELIFRGLKRNVIVDRTSFRMTVRRDHLVDDAVQELTRVRAFQPEFLRGHLSVRFFGEEATDVGGVSREFVHLLIEPLFSADYGLFSRFRGRYYCIDVTSPEVDMRLFDIMGTAIALAVCNQMVVLVWFPRLMYRKMLGLPVELSHLQEIDEKLVASLRHVLATPKERQAFEELDLTFSVIIEHFGHGVVVPLGIDDMQAFLQGDVEVTDIKEVTPANAAEYVSEYIESFAHRSVRAQFDAFCRGLRRIFTRESIKCFNEEELDIVVSGEESFDWRKV
jgi:hypothetical protein